MRKTFSFLVLLPFLASIPPAEARPYGYAQRLQNDAADRYELTRIADRDQLRQFIAADLLVDVDDTAAYVIDKTLGEKDPDHRALYSHARPWTKTFLDRELGTAHDLFGRRYIVTSLVRTRDYQRNLCRSNANAISGGYGWRRSSHLTGATVDISRIGLSRKEDAWLRNRLETLQSQGKVLFIQEYGQYCYHVMVLPSYAKATKATVAKRDQAKKPRKHKQKRKTRHR